MATNQSVTRNNVNRNLAVVDTTRQGDLTRVVMDNGTVRLEVLPDLGGKMRSLKSLLTGREFLLQPPAQPYRHAEYGAVFEEYDASGFDECFPTVSQCDYPVAPFAGVVLPDHGELWSVPWKHEVIDGELHLAVTGVRLPYVFRTRIKLLENVLETNYRLTNESDVAFEWLWSAHPLLAAERHAEIVLPKEVDRVLVNSSAGNNLGKSGDFCNWPRTCSGVHLDKIIGPEQGTADKLFSPRLSEGSCGVYFPSTDEAIAFHFDPASLPYVGIWICQGGWPTIENGHFTVALEPCTARADSLAEAVERGESFVIGPHKEHSWSLRIELRRGEGRRLITPENL